MTSSPIPRPPGSTENPIAVATRVVAARFPGAVAAFLAGSALTPRRTATSDLDLVVVVPDDHPAAPYRETATAEGWQVELFVHTPASLLMYRDLERARRRPVLDLMCAHGVVLDLPSAGPTVPGSRVDPTTAGGRGAAIAADARRSLAELQPLSAAELDPYRYALTDALDDLLGPPPATEVPFVAARLLELTAELALLAAGQFVHTGKWLARALQAHDPALLAQLVSAHRHAVATDDPAPLVAVVRQVLEAAGGPLSVGHRADGLRPAGQS